VSARAAGIITVTANSDKTSAVSARLVREIWNLNKTVLTPTRFYVRGGCCCFLFELPVRGWQVRRIAHLPALTYLTYL